MRLSFLDIMLASTPLAHVPILSHQAIIGEEVPNELGPQHPAPSILMASVF